MNLIQDIYKYLKEGGNVYIWDIDKKIKETFNGKIKNFIARRKGQKYIYKGFKCTKG